MAANIADLFEHAVDAFGDRVAVACGEREITYAELEETANRLAHFLQDRGVGKGAHVGLYAGNSIEAVVAMIAVYKLRAVVVNVNYRYVENELQYLFDDAGLVALIHDRGFSSRVKAVASGMRAIVALPDGTGADFPDVSYEAALAAGSSGRDFGPRSGDDVYLLYTGGTTGYPKGVIWRHEDVWRVLGGGIDFMSGIPLDDEWAQSRRGREMPPMTRFCLAPLIHGNAQWAALAALFAGDTVVFLPHFDAGEVWRTVERRKVNVVVLIGDAMARPIIEAYLAGDYDGSSLVAISSSAALFSPSVKRQYLQALPDVMVTDAVGSSETGFAGIGIVADVDGGAVDGPRVMPGPGTIVIDDHGRRAGPGVIGRLARGGHVPLGYYKDPVKTAALLTEVDGVRYAIPGDLARLEDDGTITLLGRGNTCINTGGEKVFPEEVEGALKAHPDVFDALVIGAADDRLGQRVVALVQPRPEAALDLGELDTHVRQRIAGYKAPRGVWLVDRISRTISGKADYRWAHSYVKEHDAD
ncbi:acyl-CoA synthetase [Actinoplanes xinjiangensis]|uniref:Acyl-CoA synthetase (AMP-forming)/AMP-acid ligase II n=1 Tax=Actinoplanes xinjiangensis TaxID=512350 RepID=A0A316FIT5_9ACTN|nr:acyl-CoA synthetase [Actinoplanes xinjiangensis]PWK48828.1 acyl-CoA synthetase (AMP-forming)/AMP-acid ligase II [Actinoplanes xinjiangensis]GIF38535.1 acyl-CoA synthetase [Actinoplanes xinjiangensis]